MAQPPETLAPGSKTAPTRSRHLAGGHQFRALPKDFQGAPAAGIRYNKGSPFHIGVFTPMFDLFRSRDKAVRIGLGALLVLVALSMLTYLIPSYNTGSSPTDVVIADVGGEQITLPDIQRLIQNTVRGRQLPPEILPNFIPQIIDNAITERALAYEAGRLGFEVTDAQVADA